MIRPFHDTTLTDIMLSKLATLPQHVFFAGYEPVFEEKCRRHNVPFVQRTQRSATIDEPASEVYSFLQDVPYDYLLHVNGCIPFLRTETIVEFLQECASDRRPAFGVFRVKNFFVHLDGTPINFPSDLKTINSKIVQPIFEFGHTLYFYRREHFLRTGRYWDWSEVRYIEIPYGMETLDIDTEEDFFMAEAIWKAHRDCHR